jgi:hypothetical protein
VAEIVADQLVRQRDGLGGSNGLGEDRNSRQEQAMMKKPDTLVPNWNSSGIPVLLRPRS